MIGGVLGLNNNPTNEEITIPVSNWQFNSQTNLYEYTVTDNTVTQNHFIEAVLDIANQKKISKGQITSYNGGYKIQVEKLPEEAITMTIIKTLTREV